jgi:uncharacterized membrane protein YeaQ/YmgE (transglycosylase-associated protein family)
MKDRRPSDDDSMSDRQTYNLITDTVVGPNLRWRDNLYQLLAIIVCAGIGAAIGYFLTQDRIFGGMIGLIAGLMVGLIGSGTFLMIYRAVRHARGKHD